MKSIKSKILLLILGCIFLSALTIGGVGLYNARSVVDNDSVQIMRLVCAQKAQEMDDPLQSIEQSVNMLYEYIYAQMDLESLGQNDSNWYELIERVEDVSLNTAENTEDSVAIYFRLNPEVTAPVEGFYLVRDEENGQYSEQMFTDLAQYEKDDLAHVGWYYEPLQKERPVWLEPYYSENFDREMISYVIPVIKGRDMLGVVGMDIDLSLLTDTVNSVNVYNSGYAFLISPGGDIVYHKDYPDGIKREDFEGSLLDVKYILSKKRPGEEIYEYNWHGQPRKMVLKSLLNEMKIAVTVPSAEIDAPQHRLLRQSLISLAVIVVFAVLAAFQVTGRVIRPLKQLTMAAGRMAKGELDGVIECRSRDEVGVLAESFQKMAKNLKGHIEYINQLAYTDALTNSQNKTAYTDRTNRLDLEIKEGKTDFAVLVMDLNNLKKMNDTYGHEYGDMLIVDAAGIMQKTFGRLSVYRIGGDEFSVILDGENFEKYTELLDKFRKEIVRFNQENKRYEVELQVACGAAAYTEGKDRNYGDVFRRADKEMYENKIYLKQKAKEAEEKEGNL